MDRAQSRLSVLQNHLSYSLDEANTEECAAMENKKIGCGRCKATQALYCCLTSRQYLCGKCNNETLKSAATKPFRFKVVDMKSFIYFDAPKKDDESDVHRNWLTAGKGLIDVSKVEYKTLYQLFQAAAKKNANRPCLGRRVLKPDGSIGPYVFSTYKEIQTRVSNLASGLASLNLGVQDRVGIYSINRPEWVLAEYACYGQNLCTVPLYDTLGPEAAEFIIRQAEVSTVFCSRDKVATLISISQSGRVPSLKTIIVLPLQPWDKPSNSTIDFNAGLVVKSLEELERKGKETPVAPRPPLPEDICTFCYTSGTTGDPKGAMLSHGAVACDAASILMLPGAEYTNQDAHLSFLPLPHVFERLTISLLLSVGARAGFFRGDINLLLDDIGALQPTAFVGVPRLYNRIYDKINAQVKESGGIKKWLFDTAYSTKQANMLENGELTHWLWDRLVFKKTKAAMGGKLRLACTGSAPIAPKTLEFMRIAFSASVCEGYGLTETSAAATVTDITDHTAGGHVGVPLPLCEVKLVDVPDMNYFNTDVVKINGTAVAAPRGEICIRGANLFNGYYKAEDKTKEALDDQGWLHTGDIGTWLPSGDLKIIDRKKNIFKLAQGEYVAPEKIEQVYCHSPFIAQMYVHGDSLQNELIAIVIPDVETITPYAKKNNIPGGMKEWVNNKQIRDMILADMAKEAKKAQLRGFEVVKSIHLDSEPFSVENGLLTPTMKLKRNETKQKYIKELTSMYKQINLQSAGEKSKL